MLRIDSTVAIGHGINFRDYALELAKRNGKLDRMDPVRCYLFLLYDETHPYLRKVLRDKDFWDALDKLTGDRLAVITYGESEFKEESPMIGMMIHGGNPFRGGASKSNSKLMEEVFGLKISRKQLPLIVISTPGMSAAQSVTLASVKIKNTDDAYERLRTLIGGLGRELEKHQERDLKYADEVQMSARDFLSKNITWVELKQTYEAFGWIGKLAAYLMGFPLP
jgi:hypothetical protein